MDISIPCHCIIKTYTELTTRRTITLCHIDLTEHARDPNWIRRKGYIKIMSWRRHTESRVYCPDGLHRKCHGFLPHGITHKIMYRDAISIYKFWRLHHECSYHIISYLFMPLVLATWTLHCHVSWSANPVFILLEALPWVFSYHTIHGS